MQRYSLTTTLILLIFTTPSEARNIKEIIVDRKENQSDSLIFEQRVSAAADAFAWTNEVLRKRGDAPLYCQPRKLAVTKSQAIQILEDGIAEDPELGSLPAGALNFALLQSLIKTFPCDGP